MSFGQKDISSILLLLYFHPFFSQRDASFFVVVFEIKMAEFFIFIFLMDIANVATICRVFPGISLIIDPLRNVLLKKIKRRYRNMCPKWVSDSGQAKIRTNNNNKKGRENFFGGKIHC